MKKASTFLVVLTLLCVFFLGGTFVLWKNPRIANQIVLSIEDTFDNFSPSKSIVYSNDFKINELQCSQADFYYNILTEPQKIIYSAIAVSVKDMNAKVKIKQYKYIDDRTVEIDVAKALESFLSDHPEVFYIDNKYTISSYESLTGTRIEIDLKYLITDINERNIKIKEIENEINKLLVDLNGKTYFEIELAIHDNLGKNVKYYNFENLDDVPPECHNIYGTLIKKEAVCDGFSKCVKLLLDKANIESIMVLGTLEETPHAWNLINLDNEWYHFDLTSDKSIYSNNNDILVHSYFNITTESILKTHKIDLSNIIPNATADKYNYYIKTDNYITGIDNFDNKFKKIISNDNKDIIEFRVKNVIGVPEKMVNALRKFKFKKYLTDNATKFNYYSILDTYVISSVK